jgi:hypothetical protein
MLVRLALRTKGDKDLYPLTLALSRRRGNTSPVSSFGTKEGAEVNHSPDVGKMVKINRSQRFRVLAGNSLFANICFNLSMEQRIEPHSENCIL